MSRWREYRADGSLIEGHGVPADIVDGIDTVLAFALDYLRLR